MDMRILVQAEEELEQTLHFSRLFPSSNLDKYAELCQGQSYSDSLLQAWEVRYGGKSGRGREVLAKLLLEGVHATDFEPKNVTTGIRKVGSIVAMLAETLEKCGNVKTKLKNN